MVSWTILVVVMYATCIVVVQNKSILLLKIIFKNTQTLQLFAKNIKTKSIYNSYQKGQEARLGFRNLRNSN